MLLGQSIWLRHAGEAVVDVKSGGCEEKKVIDKVEQLTTEQPLASSHLGKEADIIRMNFTRMI